MAEKSKLETRSAVTQAMVSVLALAFGVWAFFFSSLSQKLEESFRTELNLAKIELIEAKREKARVEFERERLAASTQQLSAEKSRLTDEIAAAHAQLAVVQQDRSKYATSTLALIKPQYAAMVSYELGLNTKVAEICSRYDEHRAWLRSAKPLAELEAKLEAHDLTIEQMDELYSKMEKLRDKAKEPKFWFAIPNRPQLTPELNPVVLDGRTAALLNALGDYNKFHQRALEWLMEQIVDRNGKRAMTGGQFIERTKQYEFLAPLLPEEREAFNKSINEFLVNHPEFRDAQINVTASSEPDGDKLIDIGKKTLPAAQGFEKAFLEHLKSIGIAG